MALNLSALKKPVVNPFLEKTDFGFPEAKLPEPKIDLKINTSALTTTPEIADKGFFTPTEKVRVRDIVREIPSAYKKVGQKVSLITKNIGQEIARNIGSAGVTVGGAIGRVTFGEDVQEVEPPKALQAILRSDPIRPVERRIADAELKLKSWGEQNKGTRLGDFTKNNALTLAFTGIIADTGLDLTPIGGAKNAFKSIKQIDNIGDAFSLLKKMGADDDLAKQFSEQVVKAKTDDAARKLITKIAEIKRTTKPVLKTDALKQPIQQEIAKAKADDITTSIQKAKAEGKSFEEFVKAQSKPVYHGSPAAKKIEIEGFKIGKNENLVNAFGRGSYLSTSKKNASAYAGLSEKGGGIVEAYLPKDVKLKTVFDKDAYNIKTEKLIKEGYDGVVMDTFSGKQITIFNPSIIKTKSQLKQLWDKEAKVEALIKEPKLKPAVIQGETFTLGKSELIQPTTKELRVGLKQKIKATKQEIKNADIARTKALKLAEKQQKLRQDALENINRQFGETDNIVKKLENKNLSKEDIDNIILEDGTKLIDTVKVKRNADKSLASVIKKSDIEDIRKSYTGKIPDEKWRKVNNITKAKEGIQNIAKGMELPQVFLERKGLSRFYDDVIEAGRSAEALKTSFIKRFKDADLFKEGLFTKEGGWVTPPRFNLSKKESDNIGKYYLARQRKGYNVKLEDLTAKEKKFVEIFDGIIKETEPRFFDTAKKMGKTPRKVEDYAPIMTKDDIELADTRGSMDWLFRKHPAFFSLKERTKTPPTALYETDYRKVAGRWLSGVTDFINYGETTQDLKYLLNSEQFKKIVSGDDYDLLSNWLKNVTTAELPTTAGGKAATSISKLLRKGVALGSLGLNYASVVKQALTQIPIFIIEKARPKLKSEYAKAFGINVSELPSITKRKGDIAIADIQGRIGSIFTGGLAQFDKKNAQWALNGLLDKEYNKFLKQGAEITPNTQKLIEKNAQDAIDMWFGGFFKGQRPEFYRKELGNFLLMFTYPLNSQLNGFYRNVLKARGVQNFKAVAEVMAAATAIAYMERSIENLSFQWSDEREMTADVLQSLLGNIPVVSQVAYSIFNEQPFAPSPVIGNFNIIARELKKSMDTGEWERTLFGLAESAGLPKQIRRVREGVEIIEEGGITDKSGKMLAPVKETDEIIRSVLRGKYGSNASKDWVRNIGEKKEDRRWFVPQVEFLQNGDYDRKAELYNQFTPEEQTELKSYLSENQQKKLDKALENSEVNLLDEIFKTTDNKEKLDNIFK